MNSQKWFGEIFCLCELRWHGVSVVNDYADTMSVWSITTLTPCQWSQQLRCHTGNYFTLEKVKKLKKNVTQNVIWYFQKLYVRVVNDYVDTDKTTLTLLENLKGFSQILKEQSGEKKFLKVCLQTQFKNMKIFI